MERQVFLTSILFPCILVSYSCFLDYCGNSVSSLSRFLPPSLPLQNKKICVFLLSKDGSVQTSEMLHDRCKSHDFHKVKMCTYPCPKLLGKLIPTKSPKKKIRIHRIVSERRPTVTPSKSSSKSDGQLTLEVCSTHCQLPQ